MKRKINLRDPEFEPTDEELAELMRSAFAEVRAKREARGDPPPPALSAEDQARREARKRAVAEQIAAGVRKQWMEPRDNPGQS